MFMRCPMLRMEIINSNKSDVIGEASLKMLLLHFNEHPYTTVLHSRHRKKSYKHPGPNYHGIVNKK